MADQHALVGGHTLDHYRSAPHRGRTHLFLGDPASDTCDKTTVEPGNVFSPGLWTCGVAVWVEGVSPEHLPPERIAWELRPPESLSSWRVGEVAVEHRLAHVSGEGAEGLDAVIVTVRSPQPVRVWVVVREMGPAGGPIGRLEWNAGRLEIDGCVLTPERPPAETHVAKDIALLGFDLAAGQDTLAFRVAHGFPQRSTGAKMVPHMGICDGLDAPAAFARTADEWARALPARVFSPDPRVARGWEQNAWHVLAAMEGRLPRIGVAQYPILWQRDGVIILRALDLIGRGDLARVGCEALAPHVFGGGFGAEADAPGAGIWSLASHAMFSGDLPWLDRCFPAIVERVAWLERMLTATGPLRAYTDNRKPDTIDSPGGSLVCLAAKDGTVRGRMDGHGPNFYINCWCWTGWTLAAQAAKLLGRPEAASWAARAGELSRAIAATLLPHYGNERDPAVAPWPSGWCNADLAEPFRSRWMQHRADAAGARKPEPHWTYFEAASAHSALLLGMVEECWTTLSGMLDPPERWDIADHHEGPGGDDILPFGNGRSRRGWLGPAARAGNMPHNWTTAELLCLLRDLFVREEGVGLVLGSGVPRAWKTPGAQWGVRDLPTRLGPVSYTATVQPDGRVTLDYAGLTNYRVAW